MNTFNAIRFAVCILLDSDNGAQPTQGTEPTQGNTLTVTTGNEVSKKDQPAVPKLATGHYNMSKTWRKAFPQLGISYRLKGQGTAEEKKNDKPIDAKAMIAGLEKKGFNVDAMLHDKECRVSIRSLIEGLDGRMSFTVTDVAKVGSVPNHKGQGGKPGATKLGPGWGTTELRTLMFAFLQNGRIQEGSRGRGDGPKIAETVANVANNLADLF